MGLQAPPSRQSTDRIDNPQVSSNRSTSAVRGNTIHQPSEYCRRNPPASKPASTSTAYGSVADMCAAGQLKYSRPLLSVAPTDIATGAFASASISHGRPGLNRQPPWCARIAPAIRSPCQKPPVAQPQVCSLTILSARLAAAWRFRIRRIGQPWLDANCRTSSPCTSAAARARSTGSGGCGVTIGRNSASTWPMTCRLARSSICGSCRQPRGQRCQRLNFRTFDDFDTGLHTAI